VYTILVADDDSAVLTVVAAILTEPGYTVLTAQDGYEAIRILAERHVDLMLTDIKMPGLDGVQLGVQAKVMRPHLHVIYLTGYPSETQHARGPVVIKPIRAADLISVIRKELTG